MTLGISLDLETLSTHKNAVVVAIGASTISSSGAERCFIAYPDMQEQIDAGRHVSADTLKWWMKQEDAARDETFQNKSIPVAEALQMLRFWLEGNGNQPVWTKGPAFDGAVIESLAEENGMASPIHYRKHRDLRTIEDAVMAHSDDSLYTRFATVANDSMNGMVAHNAVHDSLMQGDIVRWWYKELQG